MPSNRPRSAAGTSSPGCASAGTLIAEGMMRAQTGGLGEGPGDSREETARGRCRITDSDVKMNTKTPRSPVSGKGFLSRGVVE